MGPETVVLMCILALCLFSARHNSGERHDVDIMVPLIWLLPAEYEAQYYAARSDSAELALK